MNESDMDKQQYRKNVMVEECLEAVEQIDLLIKDSNIIKIGFVKCDDCGDQYICPHAGFVDGCRTKEVVKEVVQNEVE